MTLFTVSAILLLDTLAASASIGVSSITWWILLGVLFFIPYGLISAELGTTYPEQGAYTPGYGMPSARAGARASPGCTGLTTCCGTPRCS